MSDTLQPFVLGKLPMHGDFLRVMRPGPEGDVVDQWLADGIERMHGDLGDGFEQAFQEIRPMRFLACIPGSRAGVVGLLHPSRDAAGRRFPVVMGYTMAPADDAGPDQWPLSMAGAVDGLAALLADALREDGGPQDLEQLQSALQALAQPANHAAGAMRWQAGLASRRTAALWQAVQGPGGPQAMVEALRGVLQEGYPPRFLLRLPAGHAADTSLWLALLTMWAPMGTRPIFAAWPADPGDVHPAGCRLILDTLRPRYLQPLLLPDRSSQVAYDAVGAAREAGAGGGAGAPCAGGSLLDLIRDLRR